MLKPASATRGGKGKTRRRQLDPGNQCITGKVFLDAIRAEAERKEREKEEKEEKKREKARLAEEKKKKAEERKKKRKRKEMPRAKPKGQPAQKKKIEELLNKKASYVCKICCKSYVEGETTEWVECDFCFGWFHINCTNLPVLDDLGENINYTRSFCEDEGYPSHMDY